MPKTSQVTRVTRAMSVVSGLQKRFPPSKRFSIDGKVHSRKELIALFQEQIKALEQVHAAHAALRAAVARERVVARRTTKLTQGLKPLVVGELGLTSTSFADFGWELPKKRGPKTLAGKVAGAEKGRATRAARTARES